MALVLFGVLFLGVSDAQIVPPLLYFIAQELDVTPGRAGLVVASYSLAAAAFALFAGPLSDRIGRKRVLAGGLALFAAASVSTYHVSTLHALVIVRMLTGFAAGALSTVSLALAGDHYSYSQRGRAMGVISMAYSFAIVLGAPAGAWIASRWGWRAVFAGIAGAGTSMLVLAAWQLPGKSDRGTVAGKKGLAAPKLADHFRKPDRLAGMAAALLTSGGLVAYITYFGAWLNRDHGIGLDDPAFALLFMLAGSAMVAASLAGGWLSDHAGKRRVMIWSNILLTAAFLAVPRLAWSWRLWIGVAALGALAAARQPPLHALTTEIVGPEIRGEYTAIRNAASQIGIAGASAAAAYAFDSWGFVGVSYLAGFLTLLTPLCCVWLKEKT